MSLDIKKETTEKQLLGNCAKVSQLRHYALISESHESGDILYGASETLTDSQNYGCGCFWFTKDDCQ